MFRSNILLDPCRDLRYNSRQIAHSSIRRCFARWLSIAEKKLCHEVVRTSSVENIDKCKDGQGFGMVSIPELKPQGITLTLKSNPIATSQP